MKYSEVKEKNEFIVIVGCGRLGASLANTLSDEGRDVLIIDKNKDALRKLSMSYGGLALIGDGTDIDMLREAELEKATAIVVVTNNDNTNIMISQMAKNIFNKELVIARLYDPERDYVYREFEIDTISPSILSSNEIWKLLTDDEGR